MKKSLPNFRLKISFLLAIAVSIPILMFAQSEIDSTLSQNASLVESFSLLSPMAISPFWTLFITSFASTLGIGNQYIASNPMLDSGLILFISFLLVLITTLPNLTKVSKPVGLAAKFLENKAGYVIYVLMMVAPYLLQSGGSSQTGMVTFGLFNIPFSVIFIIALALPYFLVVMTVRYFLEIMIFLSPIPLLDAFFEFIKKGVTFFLIVIYFVSPTFGFILSILIFFVAFLFFKRAKKVSNFFQYVYVLPILSKLFGRKQELVSDKMPSKIKKQFPNASLAIKCLSGMKMGTIPSKSVVWLVKEGEGLSICQPKFLRSPIVVQIDKSQAENLQLSQELYYQIIHDNQSQIKLLINSTYKVLTDEISNALNLDDMGKVGLAKKKEELSEQGKKGIQKLMGIFNSGQIAANKDAILGD